MLAFFYSPARAELYQYWNLSQYWQRYNLTQHDIYTPTRFSRIFFFYMHPRSPAEGFTILLLLSPPMQMSVTAERVPMAYLCCRQRSTNRAGVLSLRREIQEGNSKLNKITNCNRKVLTEWRCSSALRSGRPRWEVHARRRSCNFNMHLQHKFLSVINVRELTKKVTNHMRGIEF